MPPIPADWTVNVPPTPEGIEVEFSNALLSGFPDGEEQELSWNLIPMEENHRLQIVFTSIGTPDDPREKFELFDGIPSASSPSPTTTPSSKISIFISGSMPDIFSNDGGSSVQIQSGTTHDADADSESADGALRLMGDNWSLERDYPYFSSVGGLTLKASVLSHATHLGFKARVKSVPRGDTCIWSHDHLNTTDEVLLGLTEANPVRYLESMHFGGSWLYPMDASCKWKIWSEVEAKRIKLTFVSHVRLGFASDHVTVYEGFKSHLFLQGTSNVVSPGFSYVSTVPEMEVEFESDFFDQEQGFYARVEMIVDEKYS